MGAQRMNYAYKSCSNIHKVGSVSVPAMPSPTAHSSTSLFYFIGGDGVEELGAIWSLPKRKRPEDMNKGTSLLQAELKLLYYTAPFEIRVEIGGFFFFSPAFLPSPPSPVQYWKHCDLQVLSRRTVKP